MGRGQVRALSVHADYLCRHSGECCRADWDVPVEPRAAARLRTALHQRRLSAANALITSPAPPPGTAAVLRREPDGCVFLDRRTHLCQVHGVLGKDALPITCRVFPRIARVDPLGTCITLSLFCPTAASALLRDDVTLAVVDAPPAFPPSDYDGLSADEWPPLLHPRMLMDHESYQAWEHHAVAVCARAGSPDATLATLARDVEALRTWTPDAGTLRARIETLDPRLATAPVPWTTIRGHYDDVRGTVPLELRPDGVPESAEAVWERVRERDWARWHAAASRYLAVHAFASWCAFQGRGLRSFVRSLEIAHAILAVHFVLEASSALSPVSHTQFLAAVRQSDLLLRHRASREGLARLWSRAEAAP